MPAPTQITEATRSVYNGTGSTIVAGAVVVIDDSIGVSTIAVKLPGAATDPVYGVAENDIPNLTWGTVITRGVAKCNAHGALATKGIRVQPTTAGRVDTHSTTNSPVGILLSEASAQDDIVLVDLLGPGACGI